MSHEKVKTLTLDQLLPDLPEKEEEEQPKVLSKYQTSIFEALSVLNPDTPDLWRLIAFFLPQFNHDSLILVQERPPAEAGIWRGIVHSKLLYEGQIAWEKETEYIFKDGSAGSTHDARLLNGKELLVVDETLWAYFYRKKGHPECKHDEYKVVSLLRKANIEF